MTAKTSAHPLMPKQLIEWLLAVLFIVSPFYIASSLGGTGLDLPFNITVWLVAVWVIGLMIWQFSRQAVIRLPVNTLALLAMPAMILLSAVLAGVSDPVDWFFRIAALVIGISFFFGLFQLRAGRQDRLLLILAVATFLHSILGVMQLFRPGFVTNWLPATRYAEAIGVFQQVNVMASFLVTGILICIYLLARPIVERRIWLQVALMTVLTLATYVAVSTGSRVGLLGLLLGTILLIFTLWPTIRKKRIRFLVSFLLMALAVWQAQEGLHKSFDKSFRLVEASYADQRMIIYRVTWQAFRNAPLFGHGIGSFSETWDRASVPFYQANLTKDFPASLGHPHNEFLFWGAEGGLVALTGIIIALSSVLWLLLKQGRRRQLAFVAFLLPISLHSQLEMPFYLSALHWLVWLSLLAMLLSSITILKPLTLSQPLRSVLKVKTMLFLLLASVFLLHSLVAQQQLDRYAKALYLQQPTTNLSLVHAVNNPYFQRDAEQLLVRQHLYEASRQGDAQTVQQSLHWVEQQIKQKPNINLFIDLLNGYGALGNKDQQCDALLRGLAIYPAQTRLQQWQTVCDENN